MVDNSLYGLIRLNEVDIQSKGSTIDEFSMDEFRTHALVDKLKNKQITKVNLGGHFGLECNDRVFGELLEVVESGIVDNTALEELTLCNKTLI